MESAEVATTQGSAPEATSAPASEPSPSSQPVAHSYSEAVDQILADDSDSPSEASADAGAPPVEAQPAVAEAPASAPAAPEDLSQEAPLEWNTLTQERKAFLQSDKALRATFWREQQFRDLFGSPAEAREIRQLVPDVQTGREMAQHAATLAELDRVYREDPARFASQIAQANPEGFVRAFAESRGIAYQISPEAFRESYAKPQVTDTLENLREIHSNDENVQAAVEILKAALGVKQGNGQEKPENNPWKQRAEELERQNQMNTERVYTAFEQSVSGGLRDGLDKAISDAIGKTSFDEETVARVKSEVMQKVLGNLNSRRELVAAYEARKRSGGFDQAHMQQAVNFALAYAKPYVAPAVTEVLGWWTPRVVAGSQQALSAAKATQTKDIGAGGPAATNRPALPPRGEDGKFKGRNEWISPKTGRPLTAREILDSDDD